MVKRLVSHLQSEGKKDRTFEMLRPDFCIQKT